MKIICDQVITNILTKFIIPETIKNACKKFEERAKDQLAARAVHRVSDVIVSELKDTVKQTMHSQAVGFLVDAV